MTFQGARDGDRHADRLPGLCWSTSLEAVAGVQLLRLERFSHRLADCHLAVEARNTGAGITTYDARLDLITGPDQLKPVGHYESATAEDAVRRAFDIAEEKLLAAPASS